MDVQYLTWQISRRGYSLFILIKCYGSRSSLNLKSYQFFYFQTKQIRLSDIGISFGRVFFKSFFNLSVLEWSETHVYVTLFKFALRGHTCI